MPHSRERYAIKLLESYLKHSPIVGVLGQRQVGKTTLTEAHSAEYVTLDVPEDLTAAKKDSKNFLLSRKSPFTIDECQYAPPLFSALKEWVRTHPKKGQFILTGSVRFTSRQAIRESLTGRIVNLELLPFSPAEACSEALPETLVKWVQAKTFTTIPRIRSQWVSQMQQRFEGFLNTGGLPGICFYRDEHVRAPRFESHVETLLERDIRLLVNTPLRYTQLKELLILLAKKQGEPVNYSALGRKVGVTAPSVRKLIGAMESIFLVRVISTENRATPVIFLEDQGLASYLAANETSPEQDLTRGLFSCILPQFLYRPELLSRLYQYRTRGGAKVDIVVRTKFGTIGIIPVAEDRPTLASIASAKSFLANTSAAKVVIAHQGSDVQIHGETLISLPYPLLISDQWV